MFGKVVLSLLIASALCAAVPAPQILARTLDINDLLLSNGPQTYSLSFQNAFTTAPQFATTLAGWNLLSSNNAVVQGFNVNFASGDITAAGAVITVAPYSDWKKLSLRWVACVGDYLQVFPFSLTGLTSSAKYFPIQLPFPFASLSFQDPSSTVVVSTPLSGFKRSFASLNASLFFSEVGVFPGIELYSTFQSVAASLEGTNKVFSNGNVNVVVMPAQSQEIQFTLLIARAPTASETYGFEFTLSFELLVGTASNQALPVLRKYGSITADATKPIVSLYGLEYIDEEEYASITTSESFSLLTANQITPAVSFGLGNGQYQITAVNVRYTLTCESSCATCSDVTELDCLTCTDTLPKDGASGKCKCASHEFRALVTGTCTSCDASCATCSGSAVTNCLTCPDTYQVTATHTCTCTAGFYRANVVGGCSACDSSCSTCNGGATANCLTCPDTFPVTSTHTCTCPTGFFRANVSGGCSACHSTCRTCSGSAANNCLTCPDTFPLNSNTCTCSAGSYRANVAGGCTACSIHCTACTSATACTGCQTNYHVSGGVCVANTCTSPCLTCTTESTTCASCVAQTYLSGTTCVACTSPCSNCTSASACSSCITGYYLAGSTCTKCPTGCLACSSATSCSTCSDGFYLAGNVCTACPASYNCLTCGISASKVVCFTCDSVLYFKLTGAVCKCVTGKTLDANGNCV